MKHQLLGEYECKLDDKGRLRIPSGLIQQLGESGTEKLVINRGFEKYLTIYPEQVWEKITSEINQLNLYNKKNRDFVRYFYRGAQTVVIDKSDRILITRRLLDYAGLKKDAILSAFNDRVELWSKEEYDILLRNEPRDFSDLAEDVLGAGNPS